MPHGPSATQGRRVNPLFPLAADPTEQKDFKPFQAVQRFVSDVRSKFDKPKPQSDTATAIDAVAAATRGSPSQSQTQAKDLISSLSNKGFVLAKTQPVDPDAPKVTNPAAIISKEELGRATWIFLHTLAVQYPKSPTKQQQKDVKSLVRANWFCRACDLAQTENALPSCHVVCACRWTCSQGCIHALSAPNTLGT